MNQNMQSQRMNDYPELQIGYPERNDVRNPNWEMERIHVDFENFQITRTNADGVNLELKRRVPVEDRK